MTLTLRSSLVLLRSAHPVPSLSVSLFAALFSIGLRLDWPSVALVGAAVLAQQLSVGLSNDWLDFKRDRAVGRADKPAASGEVEVSTVRTFAFVFAAVAMVLSLFLGPAAGLLMVPMLLVGWGYNLGMKSNWTSFLPYAAGFGLLPIFVTLSAEEPFLVDLWVIAAAALLGVSAHFANALPDLIEDRATGVRALPHILGQRWSAIVISASAASASLIIVTLSRNLDESVGIVGFVISGGLALASSLLALRPRPPKIVFTLLLLASLTNVVLLMLGV